MKTHGLKAFTLVETLVAITIIALAILAPFEAIQHVIREARVEKEQLIAASLAQEGMEYVRFIRTTNYLQNGQGSDYMAGIDGSGNASLFGNTNCKETNGNCSIDPTQDLGSAIAHCHNNINNPCDPLYIDSDGFYTQNALGGGSGGATPYERSFYIDKNGDYETVTVSVNWSDMGVAQTPVTLKEDFYDWF